MARTRTVPAPTARRARGEGSISYQTRTGLYIGQVDIGTNGKRQRRSVSGHTRAEVAAKLAELREQAKHVDLRGSRGAVSALLQEWVDQLRSHQDGGRYSPTTINGYRKVVETYLIPYLGHLTLDQIGGMEGPDHITAMLEDLAAKGLKEQTRLNVRNCLSSCLRWAKIRHRVATNAARETEAPRASRFQGKSLRDAQRPRLRETFRGHPLEAALMLSYLYGLRRSEVLGLQWHHVDLDDPDQPALRIEKTLHELPGVGRQMLEAKNEHSRRLIPLTDEMVQLLRARQARQDLDKQWSGARWHNPHNLVFTLPEAHGAGVPPSDFTLLAVDKLIEAGIRRPGEAGGFRLHDLRHNAISYLLVQGVPLLLVQKIAGHKSLATTSRYAHVNREDLDLVKARLS